MMHMRKMFQTKSSKNYKHMINKQYSPWFTHPVLFNSLSLPTVRKKDKAFSGSILLLDDASVPYTVCSEVNR